MTDKKAIAKVESNKIIQFSEEEQDLILKTFGPNLTKAEFKLFCYTAESVGLNPLKRQIYAVKRKQWNSEKNAYEERMTIQTGIDGFRAVSTRNGGTIPGKEPTYRYVAEATKDNPAKLESATAYLRVFGKDLQYHDVSATAYWDEYVPLKKDGTPQAMWAKMPRVMLAKCAEAILHRKCNPEDLSGIYTTEEMQQADSKEQVIEIESVEERALPSMSKTEERSIKPGLIESDEVLSEEGNASDETVDVTPNQPQDQNQEPQTPEGDIVETTDGKAIQGRLLENFGMHKNIAQVKKHFPEATVKKVKRTGKFGFLDEVAELKKDVGSERYYELLGEIGKGEYTHADQISDRQEQIDFWRKLKAEVKQTVEEEQD